MSYKKSESTEKERTDDLFENLGKPQYNTYLLARTTTTPRKSVCTGHKKQ